jgi:hypothetical protein
VPDRKASKKVPQQPALRRGEQQLSAGPAAAPGEEISQKKELLDEN